MNRSIERHLVVWVFLTALCGCGGDDEGLPAGSGCQPGPEACASGICTYGELELRTGGASGSCTIACESDADCASVGSFSGWTCAAPPGQEGRCHPPCPGGSLEDTNREPGTSVYCGLGGRRIPCEDSACGCDCNDDTSYCTFVDLETLATVPAGECVGYGDTLDACRQDEDCLSSNCSERSFVDVGVCHLPIGDECTAEECERCRFWEPMAGDSREATTYCTRNCEFADDCPSGWRCTRIRGFDELQFCRPECDSIDDCRFGTCELVTTFSVCVD